MTDGELVRQIWAGNTASLTELVHRWSGRILAQCHALVRRGDVAPDLAQETLLRGIRSLNTLQEPEHFGAWLRGIGRRVCLDWLKAKARTTVPFSSLNGQTNLANEIPGRPISPAEEHQEDLSLAMAELPEECREVVLLYYYQDVTYQELATVLQVSSATVNARLTKARMLLRQKLCPQESRS